VRELGQAAASLRPPTEGKDDMGKRIAIVLGAAAGVIALGAQMASATFPGTDGRIAFSAFVEETESIEIYSANPNGGDVQQLTSNPNLVSENPDWSPDGQRIAFQAGRLGVDAPVQVDLMNADGSDVTRLTRGPGFHGYPAWSPDAASLAIAADWGDHPALQGIWIIPASDPGGVTQQEARRVTTLPADFRGQDVEPQFSPDGSSIVFTRFKSARKSAIHRVGVDGTGLERLTKWKLNASDPDWSPNGKKIAFDSGDFAGETDGGGNIHVMRADGTKRRRLTDHTRLRKGDPFKLANNPVWSPSGNRIMFTRFVPEATKLIATKPNGSGKHVVVGGRFGKRHFPNRVDWGTHP
jgi:Tol biopolymer transport system component